MQIPLNDEAEYEGGRLVWATEAGLTALCRGGKEEGADEEVVVVVVEDAEVVEEGAAVVGSMGCTTLADPPLLPPRPAARARAIP